MATESISTLVIDDNPPPLNITIPKKKDLPRRSTPWRDVELPVDFLLITVKDCEFLSCYHFLKNSFKSCSTTLGFVYFGKMGGDQSLKLRVALMKCSEGSSVPGGSLVVVKNAVTILRPKAVFCVGACLGLQRGKAKLGDVVVSSKLTQYAGKNVTDGEVQPMGGARVPVSRDVSRLIRHAGDGWEAPLLNPSGREVEVHCDAEYLSGPEFVRAKWRCDELVAMHPEAMAIDMEGEGVYVAAYDMKMEWLVVKGMAGYADGTECDLDKWAHFASVMAASVVNNILLDSVIFQSWPNFKGEPADEQMPLTEPCAEFSRSTAMAITVKEGTPSNEELETLSQKIAEGWKPLGRRLEMDESKLTAFDKENEEYSEKPYKMLLFWKQREGSAATYQVLHDALCHPLVNRRDLAEEICGYK